MSSPTNDGLQDQPDLPRTTSAEEVLTISDQMMVFRSKEDSAPNQVSKKMMSKASRARLKMREDTPTPPTKGEGRKRFDLSPFPEDKQISKRLDFGSGGYPTYEALEPDEEISPANPQTGLEDSLMPEEPNNPIKNGDREMKIICPAHTIQAEKSPDSGIDGAGDVMTSEEEDDNRLEFSNRKDKGSAGTKGILVEELVNLPEMALETKSLLESCLVPCHLEESHGALAVGFPMQPKNDNIMHLASLHSAEMLDNMVAQPLLVGGPSEESRMLAEAFANHSPPAEVTLPNPSATYVPSFEEFPPLEKGRTLKLRDSFEAGVPQHGKGSAWSMISVDGLAHRDTLATVGTAPRGSTTTEGVTEGVPSVGHGARAGLSSANPAGGSKGGQRNVNTPRAKEDLIMEEPTLVNAGTSS